MNSLSADVVPSTEGMKDPYLPDSEGRVVEELTRTLSEFGKINSISFMPPAIERGKAGRGKEELVFFVSFEKSDAAMSAANCLDCILYGFSTVVVRVPRAAVHAASA